MNESWRERATPLSTSKETPPDGESGGSPLQTIISLVVVAVAVVAMAMYARNALISTALFLVILLGLVMAHEAAHFFTAKAFGIMVHEFAFGFPPRIWGKRIGETIYTFNWLPVGGFVRLEGEEAAEGPRSFASQAAWKRFIVLAAGAVTNLLLPIFLFSLALTFPHQLPEGRAKVTGVVAGTPAEAAGLKPDDVIIAIGGRNAKNISEASRYVRLNQGKTFDMEVTRGGQSMHVAVYGRWAPPTGQGPTGISIAPLEIRSDGRPYTITASQLPWESIPNAMRMTWDTMILARNEVVGWFKGTGGPQFAGPVGIAQTTGEVARSSETTAGAISPLLELAALLSINLGIMNLLPLPMLDGGRIFFLLIEVVRGGKRIAPEREAIVHMIGFAAFIVLAIVVTFADISRILGGRPPQ
ncbi:MAG: RIP metalloprotease [Chloroflexi bacterium]|nr:MAG: RIP metalloprotease [Chloroflexota bacterium]